jgi:hypothetical protein
LWLVRGEEAVEVAVAGVPLGIHGKWGEMLGFMAK